MKKLVAPFGAEAVLAQSFVLGPNVDPLLDVRGEPKAAGAAERISGKQLDPVEGAFGPQPELPRGFCPVRLACDVVARGGAPQRKTSVAAARPCADSARIVHTHTQPALCERVRARAAGDPGPDHGDVDVIELERWCGRPRLLEPERSRLHGCDAMRMPVLEIRTYRLREGTSAAFHRLLRTESVPLLQTSGIDVVRFGPSEQNEEGVEEYVLIRAFPSPADRDEQEDRFYGSDEWLAGPRERILNLIESYHTIVLTTSEAAIDALRG